MLPFTNRMASITVDISKTGRLTSEQLSSAKDLIGSLKATDDEVVTVIYGRSWSKQYTGHTFSSAYQLINRAKEPMYTANMYTSSWPDTRFFTLEEDIMTADVFGRLDAGEDATEDLLIGSKGSYSSVHIDNAPCTGSRITVLEGRKELAAWPFNPSKELPSRMPVHEVTPTSNSPQMTAAAWDKIKEYALEHGGWVVELGPGGCECSFSAVGVK
jgi:hypothetical protein